VVRMVVTPAKIISVQALYRMRSARQRLAVHLPEGAAFDTQPLRINGHPVALEKGQQNEYFVPLVAANADTPFVLELRYTLDGDGSQLDLPDFPQEPAVVKAYLGVYLPETRTLLGVRGPWNEEFRWKCDPAMRWQPSPRMDADSLVAWVREGVAFPASPGQEFQTDGRMYVYSTLRPAAGSDGSLAMTTIDDHWLSGLVFAVTVLLGLLLLPARLPARTLVVGVAIVVLVLAGVFLPTFSMQILNGVLVSAIFIVAVMWAAGAVVRLCGNKAPNAAPPASPSPAGEQATPEGQEGGPANA